MGNMLFMFWYRYWPFVVLTLSVAAAFGCTAMGEFLAWDILPKFGQGPAVLHVLNIFIHTLNTYLVYVLAKKLLLIRNKDTVELGDLGRQAFALIAALIFAVHPLQVEVVSALIYRRDLMAGFFGLSAVLVAWDTSDRLFPTWAAFLRRVLATGLFLCSLVLNPALAALPIAIKWLSHFTERRGLKWPMMWLWLALGTGAAGMAYGMSKTFIKIHLPTLSLTDRLLIAADSLGFYIDKFFSLTGYSADYGRTPDLVLKGTNLLPDWPILVLFAAVALALTFLLPRAMWGGLGFFVLTLLPVSGLVEFAAQADSTVADHYAYLPIFGLGFAFAVLVAESKTHLYTRTFLVYLLIGLLGIKSFERASVWRDNRSLFGDILKTNSASHRAWLYLARAARQENNPSEARDFLTRARAIKPNMAAILAELAELDAREGRHDDILRLRSQIEDPEFLRLNSHDVDSLERLKKQIENAPTDP